MSLDTSSSSAGATLESRILSEIRAISGSIDKSMARLYTLSRFGGMVGKVSLDALQHIADSLQKETNLNR